MREQFMYCATNILLNIEKSPLAKNHLTVREILSTLKNPGIILYANMRDISRFSVDEEKLDKGKLTNKELSKFAKEITSSIRYSILAKANIKMLVYIKIKKLIYIGIMSSTSWAFNMLDGAMKKQVFGKYSYSLIQNSNKVAKIQEEFFNNTKDKEVEHFIEDYYSLGLCSIFYDYGCYKVGTTFCETITSSFKLLPCVTYSVIDDTDQTKFYTIIPDATFDMLLLQTQLNDERNCTLKTILSDINKRNGLISYLYNHFPPESLESKIKIIETLKELDIEIDKEI